MRPIHVDETGKEIDEEQIKCHLRRERSAMESGGIENATSLNMH